MQNAEQMPNPLGIRRKHFTRFTRSGKVQSMMERHRFFVTTARGIEPILTDELKNLSHPSLKRPSVKSVSGGAFFEGELSFALRACLWLRSAFRVTLSLLEAPCESYDQLYELASSVRWQDHLKPGQTLAVDATCSRSPLTNSHLAALKVKDAVVDVLRDARGTRPDVDTRMPDLKIMVWCLEKRCVLAIDLCGDPLFMRKYRVVNTEAPLKESLAAGILGLTGWRPELAFRDPFCGSGTLVIEAALKALDAAPGRNRPYTFHQHPFFDASLQQNWKELLEEADGRRLKRLPAPILGSDRDEDALAAARANCLAAGLGDVMGDGQLELDALDVRSLPPGPAGGFLVSNPPYGERLGGTSNSVEMLYRMLGQQLKRHQAEGQSVREAWFFCANPRFESCMGLPARARTRLSNGPMETWLYGFQLEKPRGRR